LIASEAVVRVQSYRLRARFALGRKKPMSFQEHYKRQGIYMLRIFVGGKRVGRSNKVGLLIGTAAAGLLTVPAWAADAPDSGPTDAVPADSAAADAGPQGDEIVVTGSRTATTEFQSTSPITVVSAKSLEATGQPDLRTSLSAIAPSFLASQGSNGSSSSKPVRSAALRGLSGFHTLVLVNGKRRHNTSLLNNTGGSSGAPVDLSLIPASSVARIEVLSDGASALYGSDAVAGVVNIILKGDVEGGSASGQIGAYDSGRAHVGGLGERGRTINLSLNQGFKIGSDGGFLNLSAEYRNILDSNVVGPIRTASPTDAVSRIFAVIGDPRETTESRYRQLTEVVPYGEAWSVGANLEIPLGETLRFYANGTYSENALRSTGTYRSENNVATIVNVSPVGGYVPVLNTKQRDYQFIGGLTGDFGAWNWDASLSYGQNRGQMHVNGINASFGGAHSYHDFYIGELKAGELIANIDVRRPLEVSWGAGPLELAFGGEYRRNTFSEGVGEPDSYQNGGFIYPATYPSVFLRGKAAGIGSPFMTGFSPAQAGNWSRSNWAGYLDLAQDVTDALKIGLSGRYEHYSDFGGRLSGKFSARYEITPGLALRATVNNGFRAPSLAEQFTTVVNQGPNIVNGVSVQINTYNSIRFDAPAAQALGAKALKPETSVNFSAGIVARPAPNLNISIDAFQIKIDDRIGLTGQFNPSLNTPAGIAVRSLLTAAGLDPTLRVQYFANIGDTRTRGVEFKANYFTDLGSAGQVDWTLSAAYNRQKVTGTTAAIPPLASAGLVLLQTSARVALEHSSPRLIGRGIVDWTLGDFNLRATETYFSRTYTSNTNFPDDVRYNAIQRAAFITDLALSYNLTDAAKLTVGANNLFDRGADNIPAIATSLQTVGATYPLPVASPFGQGGRFLYARIGLSW
jgi:iron complex outermembrane receptor protein